MTKDLSTGEPIRRQCIRIKLNGERCKRPPIKGATVCYHHGGAAPQVRESAARRLLMAADLAAKHLIEFMTDPKVPYPTRIVAAKDLLDRAGLNASYSVRVSPAAEDPWQLVLSGLADRIRANVESGEPFTTTVVQEEPDEDEDIAEAELVEEPEQEPQSEPEPGGGGTGPFDRSADYLASAPSEYGGPVIDLNVPDCEEVPPLRKRRG